ncbi:MAG: hypothetical protein WC551_04350 [Patescibacteria group bacterium]
MKTTSKLSGKRIAEIERVLTAYGVTNAEIQKVMDARKARSRSTEDWTEEDLTRLVFWEKNFIGHGLEMMEFLKPLYRWEPKITPPVPDLERRAKKAVFWMKVKKVEVFQQASYHEIVDSFDTDEIGEYIGVEEMTEALSAVCRDRLGDPLMRSVKEKVREFDSDEVAEIIGEPVLELLKSALKSSLYGRIRRSFEELIGQPWKAAFKDSAGVTFHHAGDGGCFEDGIWTEFWSTIGVSLLCPAGFVLARKTREAAKFKPLLELMLAGNYPLRISEPAYRKGILYVLTA